MSSRASRKAALAKFRSAKRKREQGEGTDDLLDTLVKEEDDVYDVVDEDEYQSLVESRRQREDFVVDDGESVVGFLHKKAPLFLHNISVESLSSHEIIISVLTIHPSPSS